ncbi:hypothetical protein DFH28DRAFT_1136745 [Melampsora americana]|nr:hypothetical protein DFH28DRAFT_1136745 [Melampsora americana]
MDSTNPSPSMPTEPTQITQTLPPNIPAPTSTPTSNSAQNPLDSIGTNTAKSQCNPTSTNPASTTFVIPTVSPADWAHTQHTSNPSAKSISQPAMALSDSDPQNGAPQNSDGITQNDNEEDTDTIKAKKKCWFTPESDGKSDIDLVAEWCSNFENFNAWRTQQKSVVCEQVDSYLVSKGHILALTQWFNDANKLRTAMGEGNKDANMEFTTSKEELAVLKWNKRRVVKKYEEEEAGSLEHTCVNDQLLSPTKRSLPDSWEETPPHHEANDNWPSSQEQAIASLPQASQLSKPSRSVTPTYPASKRIQRNSKETPLSIGTKESPQNSLDFQSVLSRIPTKDD